MATIVQHLEELTPYILAMDAPIVNMQERDLEKPTPSGKPTHQMMKEMVFDDNYDLNDLNNQDLEDKSRCHASNPRVVANVSFYKSLNFVKF